MFTQRQTNIFEGPANWKGKDIRESDEWHFHLTDTHVLEIVEAVEKSMQDGIDIIDLTKENFELPTLGYELERLYEDVINGRGFFVGHGMPTADLNREEIIRAWIGMGTHLGDPLPQNAKGHILGHVKDLRADPTDKNQRTFGTSERQPYHTDNCDIVGLLCLKTPKSGGLFSLTSSYAVYEEMLKRRPDLLKVLEQPIVQDRRGEVPEGKQDTYEMAAYYQHKGRLLSVIDRNYVKAAQVHDYVQPLTQDQNDALDMMEAIAEEDGFFSISNGSLVPSRLFIIIRCSTRGRLMKITKISTRCVITCGCGYRRGPVGNYTPNSKKVTAKSILGRNVVELFYPAFS